MKIKRTAALLTALVMCAGMASCGSGNEKETSSSEASAAVSAEDNNTEDKGTALVSQTHLNDDMEDISAKELVSRMRVGWNLGNTLDAEGSGLDAEVAWQPSKKKTDEQMIRLVKDAGFNVLRIPVSWGGHVDGQYNIDEQWLDRVQEIVNYGIDNDMIVILNTHHEDWYMPRESDKAQDIEELKALWTQIAERFNGYDENLIFEGLNEPRLRGEACEWTGEPQAREIINEYDKAFVETVRSTGGNNENRILMVTGYAASSMRQNLEAIELPEDRGKLIVSVHAYLPYSFALDTKGTDVYDSIDSSITNTFADINDIFLSRDIPVVIGEFGSVNKFNDEERIECVTDYINTAKSYGVPCVWWDNGTRMGSGENFALLNREEYSWYYPDIVEAIMKAAGS